MELKKEIIKEEYGANEIKKAMAEMGISTKDIYQEIEKMNDNNIKTIVDIMENNRERSVSSAKTNNYIKLSKNQWKNIGIKAGWIKSSQLMNNQISELMKNRGPELNELKTKIENMSKKNIKDITPEDIINNHELRFLMTQYQKANENENK